ncbi:hypothetical protein QAD02_018661 [Eretmocerus hayati]|uniref:Uncharacterized protein n=1 Tax=Eretmocerus hayati TaxID=131215 RepID=A0ACC2PH01_9HYME|nr:hypothetical protein QAD02_018661 [Eretmocerus hayati]
MPRTVRRRRGAVQARGDQPDANIAQQSRQAPLRQQARRGGRASGIEQRHPHRAVVPLADPPGAGPVPRRRGHPAAPTSTAQQALVPEDPATTFRSLSRQRPDVISAVIPGVASVTRRPGRPAAAPASASGPGAEPVSVTRHLGRPTAASASVLDVEPVPGARCSGRPAAF